MIKKSELIIGIIGAGGIGSNLTSVLYPTLQQGDLIERLGDIRIRIYDSDIVEKSNLTTSKFHGFRCWSFESYQLM
jgi:molybdopterin/thiamine biosynthesis adenylyltransferase